MNMFRKYCWIAALAVFVSGCVTIEKYSLVSHGHRQVGNVSVSVNGAWNKVPDYLLAYSREDSEVWTRDFPSFGTSWRRRVAPNSADQEGPRCSRA